MGQIDRFVVATIGIEAAAAATVSVLCFQLTSWCHVVVVDIEIAWAIQLVVVVVVVVARLLLQQCFLLHIVVAVVAAAVANVVVVNVVVVVPDNRLRFLCAGRG